MTTGRINQVTLVKRRGKKDRSLTRPLKKSSILFFVTRTTKKIAALDQEVLLGMIVFNPKRCFLQFNTCL